MGTCPEELFDFEPTLLLGQPADIFLDVFKAGLPALRRPQAIKDALLKMAERWVNLHSYFLDSPHTSNLVWPCPTERLAVVQPRCIMPA